METKKVFSNEFKCKFCSVCSGYGCIGQMPGMGGVNNSQNVILNYVDWENSSKDFNLKDICITPEHIGIAPVTGANQNIGFAKEEDFYLSYFTAAKNCGISICAGDGAPDEKLLLGLDAVKKLSEKAYFFLKPYPQERLLERTEWIKNSALAVGVDIDAYNIVSMRNQAKLEKKTAYQLQELRKKTNLPLMVKGVFSTEDIELCKELKPEIIVVSNHGGRVERQKGSTKEFLQNNASVLKDCCDSLWVDGGIRSKKHIALALTLGAKKVLIARPFISALCKDGISCMEKEIQNLM